jgi:hypothetical protein
MRGTMMDEKCQWIQCDTNIICVVPETNIGLIQDNKSNEHNKYLTVPGDTHSYTWPRKAERETINTILWERGERISIRINTTEYQI